MFARRVGVAAARRALSSTATVEKKTWRERRAQAVFNVGVACVGCIMSSQILKMKYEKSDLDTELAATKAQLEALRQRALDVEPVAARLGVDAPALRAALTEHFSFSSLGRVSDQPPPAIV